MRKTLKAGTELPLGKNRRLVIKDVCGYGAACIVYDADYMDCMGVKHYVRVKECYPYGLPINRADDGKMEILPGDRTRFEEAKERFADAYRKNTEFRMAQGLVNSTGNTNELFDYNGTRYSLVSYDEGKIYSEYQDNSLKELLTHIRTIAVVIKKYHDNEYLHLDIKPENILILPETAEHVMLFDFDSVVLKKDLGNGDYRITFSDGFSAPEQRQGKISHIGTHTDVFSLGALLFYKLFGVKPDIRDCSLSAGYDFSNMIFQEKGFQPVLYRKLNEILKKSLAISIHVRWKETDSLIEKLNDVIELADVDRQYVYDNFSYYSSCFVGREKEIGKIKDLLEENQVVFLSGIGGIGKTELARRYAFENRKEYNRIIFCTFVDSIQSMVIEDDIRIHHFKRDNTEEDAEKDEDFFARKMSLLKQLLGRDDLIIVDNFDTEEDENLEELLELPCKFIFTSREDFSDYNYPQIDVDDMEDFEDIFQLFSAYNHTVYSEEAIEAVKAVIELVDRHTMTVELMAKYLRDSGDDPGTLYALFREKQGVMSAEEDVCVKNRKDKKLRAKSVKEHLRILFDISGFDEEESELIRSLSLLGAVRISKEMFRRLCGISSYDRSLAGLIQRGWIQQNVENTKIALHQIIMDLVYHDMKPTSENCPHIVAAMTEYLEDETENETAFRVRSKLSDLFMERISGNDIPYAALCAAYGKNKYLPKVFPKALVKAEEICEKSSEHIRYDLLQRIYRYEVREICRKNEFDFAEDKDFEDYFRNSLKNISHLVEQSFEAAEKYKQEAAYLAEVCVGIVDDTDQAINASEFMTLDKKKYSEIDDVYRKIAELYDSALIYTETAETDLDKKLELLHKLQRFYKEAYYENGYKLKYLKHPEKCIQMIKSIRRQQESPEDADGLIIYANDVPRWQIAETYEEAGEYERALALYQEAYDAGESSYDWLFSSISLIYKKMGDFENAILYLIKVLDKDKKNEIAAQCGKNGSFSYTSYVCSDLIDLLFSMERYEEALRYAKELVHYSVLEFLEKEREKPEGDYDYEIQWIIKGYFILWKLETDVPTRDKLLADCIGYFHKMKMKRKLPSELTEFLREYSGLLLREYSDDSIGEVYRIISNMDDSSNKAKTDIQSMAETLLSAIGHDKKYAVYAVQSMLKLCNLYSAYGDFQNGDKAMEYADVAERIYHGNGLTDEYLINLIYKAHADAYAACKDYDTDQFNERKRKCNYYLLADRKQEDASVEGQFELWQDAATEYGRIEDYKNQIACLEHYFDLFRTHIDQVYKGFGSGFPIEHLIEACFQYGTPDKAIDYIWKYFDILLEYYHVIPLKEPEDVSVDEAMEDLASCVTSLLCVCGQYDFHVTFILYMLSICAKLEREQNIEFYRKARYYCEEDDTELYLALSGKMDGGISYEQVDFIVEVWESCNSCEAPGKPEEKYEKLFGTFLSRYQNQDIEFRH